MKTVKRSISIRGHRTSFSLEQPFFEELQRLAGERGVSVASLVADIDANHAAGNNLSSAIRLYILEDFKTWLTER